MDVSFEQRLRSGEVNARLNAWQPITLLAGFRSLALNESLFMDVAFDQALINVSNQLYGFQVGVEGIWSWGRLSLTGFCKGGAYHAKSTLDLSAFDPVYPVAVNNHATVVGEAGLYMNLNVTRHWSFRGGYQALWTPDLALATTQVSEEFPQGISGADLTVLTNSDVFFYGFFLGAEARW